MKRIIIEFCVIFAVVSFFELTISDPVFWTLIMLYCITYTILIDANKAKKQAEKEIEKHKNQKLSNPFEDIDVQKTAE
jgi:phage terminase small subunit